uniref:CSON001664 protein n=1 Tax=Culicoides sonorensis TaxID=179676 RepID=A0A336MH94_CULSO
MKYLLLSLFLSVFAISSIFCTPLDQPKTIQKWKELKEKLEKVDPSKLSDLVFMNHLIQYNENYENKTKLLSGSARGEPQYLGCYKDHRRQRMFRGYAEKGSNAMHIDGCIDKCRLYKFAYAGVQSGDECYCGNAAPQAAYNAKLAESSCSYKCSSVAHRHEMCGGDWASSVYTTGYTVTRQDENGYVIGEHSSYSKNEWERH